MIQTYNWNIMGKLLGVSWCLPCLTIVKNSGGISTATKSLRATTVNQADKSIKNKLFNLHTNGPLITNMIPPCTTLLDTTFHASNTLLKLALLQKRDSSEKCIKLSESSSDFDNDSQRSKLPVSFLNHSESSKVKLNSPVNEVLSQSPQINDPFYSPSPLNKRSQSDMNIDSIVQESSLTLEQCRSLNATSHEGRDKSNLQPIIRSNLSAGQKSTAIVRPCLRHRRSSYDDILGQSSNKRTSRYSYLDNTCVSSKTAFKTNSILSSFDDNSSTQPLNKSVKFVLPESSEHYSKKQILDTSTAKNFNSNMNSDQHFSSPILPWTGISHIPYNCVLNHHTNGYNTLCTNPNLFPYTEYIPSIHKLAGQVDKQQPINSIDTSISHLNFSFPGASCDMNCSKPPLQLVSSNITSVKDISLIESQNETKCAKMAQNNIPAALYWSGGCIYDPTVYLATVSAPSNFCTTCWSYNKDQIPVPSYTDQTVFRSGTSCLSSPICPFYDDTLKAGFKHKLNIRFPANEANETNDTDSEDESTEGDCMNVGKNLFSSLFYLHDCLIASSIRSSL